MIQWQAVNYIDEWQRAGYEIEYLEVNYYDKEGSAELISSTLLGSDFDIFISAFLSWLRLYDSEYVSDLPICFDICLEYSPFFLLFYFVSLNDSDCEIL